MNVTRYLKPDLVGHEVFTVDDAGLKGLKNGALRAASGNFDVLTTVDRKLSREQSVAYFKLGIIALIAKSNRYEISSLSPL